MTLLANNANLYNGDFQTPSVLFTRNVSSHKTDWILTTRCLFCLFICLRNQSNKHFWSRMFAPSPSQELCRDFFCVFVYFVHINCCCVRLLFSYWCCWFTSNKFVVFVCMVCIFVTIWTCCGTMISPLLLLGCLYLLLLQTNLY